MRRRITASALAVAVLLTVGSVTAGVAHASVSAAVGAADVFYPDAVEPTAAPTQKPSAPAGDSTQGGGSTGDR